MIIGRIIAGIIFFGAILGLIITVVECIRDWWKGDKYDDGGDCSIEGIFRMIRRK
ncbi:MAG: hypothetical protein RRY55_01290 [Bacteroidales bacterium]